MIAWHAFLFNQSYSYERLSTLRLSLCTIVALLLIFGPYDSFYVETAPFLFKAKPPFTWFPNLGVHFWTLKSVVLVSCLCFGLKCLTRLTGPCFAISFLFFNYYVSCFSPYWITNTHLNLFAILLCFAPLSQVHDKAKQQLASFLVAFIILSITCLYFQAGLSKLIWGKLDWFLTGKRIWTETILTGTYVGKWLSQWPFLFVIMGITTGFIELVVPFFFLYEKMRPWAALVAILFHLGTYLVMGISFWFLWALYPALFFYPVLLKRQHNQELVC